MADRIDHTHGDVGAKPDDSLNFQRGDKPDPEIFDWFWSEVPETVNNHADTLESIDSDGDGTVDAADTAEKVKGNDIDSDGDGIVDKADEVVNRYTDQEASDAAPVQSVNSKTDDVTIPTPQWEVITKVTETNGYDITLSVPTGYDELRLTIFCKEGPTFDSESGIRLQFNDLVDSFYDYNTISDEGQINHTKNEASFLITNGYRQGWYGKYHIPNNIPNRKRITGSSSFASTTSSAQKVLVNGVYTDAQPANEKISSLRIFTEGADSGDDNIGIVLEGRDNELNL